MADFNEIYARVKAGKYTFADSTPAVQKQEVSGSSFDKIYADVKAGKYTFAGGATPLHEDHLGAYRAKKMAQQSVYDSAVGMTSDLPTGMPAVAGPAKNDFAAKAARHTLPASPVTQQVATKQQQEATRINWAQGISDETRAYDAAIESMEADSERFTELALFYDFYQKDPGQWSEPELAQQAKEKLAEYETYAKKYGTIDDFVQNMKNLRAANEEAKRRNYMQADLMDFAEWDQEDQQMLYQGIQAYADNELGVVGSIERKLYDKYGKENVKRIWESVEYSEGLKKLEAAAKAGQESPGLANTVASLPVSWLGGIMTLPYRANQMIKGGTGRYGANAYVPFSEMGVWAENTQEATKQEMGNWVREHVKAAGASEGVQNFAEGLTEFAFGAGVQIVDNLAKAAAFGGVGTLALAATTSFEQSYREAAQSGAGEDSALIVGIAKSALEVLTEKIPLDNLLNNVKAGKSSAKVVIDALKQGGIEATTEEINFLGGLVAEAVFLRDKSGYQQMVQQAMTQGMNYQTAREYATQQLYLMAAETAAMAFAAGAGSSAITSVATNKDPFNAIAQQAQERQKEETAESQTVGNEQQAQNQSIGIKDQIRGKQDELNKMPPVAQIQVPAEYGQMDITEKKSWVIEKLRSTGYKVERKGFGIIDFAKKRLKSAFNYFDKNAAEESVFEALPYVLENGIEISENANHKDRNYETVTIAAPITVGGKRGNMAVVIKQTDGNYYKVHRILAPDGTLFVLPETTNEAESTPAGGVTDNGSLATPKDPASNNSIRENVPVVNTESGDEVAQGAPITIDELTEGIVPDRRKETVNSGVEPAEAVDTQAPQQGKNEMRVPAADESVGAAPSGEYGENTVGGAESGFKHEVRRSKLYENTYANATDEAVRQVGETAMENDPSVAEYDYISEEESIHNAKLRTRTAEERSAEYNYLIEKDSWTGEDNDTAYELLKAFQKEGDDERFGALAKKQKEMNTQGGQLTQSNAKYSRSATKAAIDAFEELDKLRPDQVEKRYYEKKDAAGRSTMGKDVYYQTDTGKLANGMDNMEQKDASVGKRAMNEDKFKAWKTSVSATILDVANAIENTEDGDVEGMREIIRSLARFRHTTAWFGTQSRLTGIAEKALQTLDYDTAKDIAMAQLKQIPNDFKKRSVGQVVKTIRIHNMLGALTTVNRNLSGNASIGILDAITDSTVGRALDVLVAKYTGKRTVGNDIRYSKAYFNGAKKAAQMAALATELDIPIGAESRFSTGATRTFSPQGMGPVSKYLSAFDKAMRYALEVSDRFFSGGAESAVEASLKALGEKSNLSEAQMQELAQKTGQRRTFKDDRKLTRVAKGLKDALNDKGSDNLGAGDLIMPFAATGTNVAQTAVDYSSGGINGLIDIFRLMHDVKTGKFDEKTGTKTVGKREVSLVAAQRQAVTNAARGLTGIGLIAAFAALSAAGCLKVHEDEDYDKNALEDTQNTSGAQLNISSTLRCFSGKTTKWQDGDVLGGMDFLEPFNAQMYIGYELSKEENIVEMLKAYPKATLSGIWNSILDMPMMQSLSDLVDIFESEDAADAAGQFAGNMASGFVPATVRQAAQYIDPYYRDTSGNGVWEKALNQTKSYVPGLSQTLPKKYSGLGEEQLRYDNWLGGFFSTFVEPGDTAQLKINETVQYLGALSERTGKAEFYPDRAAPADFSYKDDDGNEHYVDLSGAEETEKYQLTYGTNIGKLYGELITMDDFTSADDETQVKILNSAKRYAVQLAKAAVSDYDEIPAYIRDRENGMSVAEALIRQAVVETTEKYGELSIDKAAMLSEAIDDLFDQPRETKPDGTSYTSVRTVQKVEAVAGSSLTEKEQKAAMADILDDKAYEKYLKILDAGYDTDDYAESYRIFADAEDGKSATIRDLMQKMNLNKRQATTIYEIYKPKK